MQPGQSSYLAILSSKLEFSEYGDRVSARTRRDHDQEEANTANRGIIKEYLCRNQVKSEVGTWALRITPAHQDEREGGWRELMGLYFYFIMLKDQRDTSIERRMQEDLTCSLARGKPCPSLRICPSLSKSRKLILEQTLNFITVNE